MHNQSLITANHKRVWAGSLFLHKYIIKLIQIKNIFYAFKRNTYAVTDAISGACSHSLNVRVSFTLFSRSVVHYSLWLSLCSASHTHSVILIYTAFRNPSDEGISVNTVCPDHSVIVCYLFLIVLVTHSLQCHVIFRNHSNMLICCSRNI